MKYSNGYITNRELVSTVADRLTTREKVNKIYGKGAMDARREAQANVIPVIDSNEVSNIFDEDDNTLTKKIKESIVEYFLNRKLTGQSLGYGTHAELNNFVKKLEMIYHKFSLGIDGDVLNLMQEAALSAQKIRSGTGRGQVIIHVNEQGINVQVRETVAEVKYGEKKDY